MGAPKSFNECSSMKSLLQDIVLGNQTTKLPTMYNHEKKIHMMKSLPEPSSCQGNEQQPSTLAQSNLVVSRKNKQYHQRSYSFTNGIKEHVKGKLSLGAKLLRVGSMKKVYKHNFNLREEERLLKVSQCCLSTTAGPISGLLFISTDKLAFRSDTSIVEYSSPKGELLKFHYKIVIPLRKIDRVSQRDNMNKASKKYLQLTTMDEFEFWFMGFLNFKKLFQCLQQALLDLHNNIDH